MPGPAIEGDLGHCQALNGCDTPFLGSEACNSCNDASAYRTIEAMPRHGLPPGRTCLSVAGSNLVPHRHRGSSFVQSLHATENVAMYAQHLGHLTILTVEWWRRTMPL